MQKNKDDVETFKTKFENLEETFETKFENLEEIFEEFSTMTVDGEIVNEVINARDGETVLLNKLQKMNFGEVGKNYKIMAGVIRNTGSGWDFIEDSVHSKMNFTTVTTDNSFITVNFGFKAKKMVSFVAAPDDTFSNLGYFIGSDVGNEFARINISKQKFTDIPRNIGAYIEYNGTDWVIDTNSLKMGNLAVNDFTSGNLNLTHDFFDGYLINVSRCSNCYEPRLGSIGFTTSQIKFYNDTGTLVTTPDTNMKVFFTRHNNSVALISNLLLNPLEVISEYGNIWIMAIVEVE